MNVELLQTFLEINRVRNFARAAENLCVSPSTISARVRQLEGQFGLALFSRAHHQISLTPAGERFVGHARHMLSAWERAQDDIALGDHQSKRLVIAGIESLWGLFLQDWLNHLYCRRTELAFRVASAPSEQVETELAQGGIDLGFLFEPPKVKEILTQELGTLPLVMLATQPVSDCRAAFALGHVRVEWGTVFSSVYPAYFPDRPLAQVRANSMRIALALLRSCGGCAYLPRALLRRPSGAGLYEVPGQPEIPLKVFAAYSLHGQHRALIEQLLQAFPQELLEVP